MKRVNIQLTERTHINAKIITALKGKTLGEYLAKIIEKAVEKEKKKLRKLRFR